MKKDRISTIILHISIRTFINVALIALLVEGFVMSYHFSYKLFADFPYQAGSKETMEITIRDGASAMEVANILDGNGIVDGKYLFLARSYLGRYNDEMRAGTYTLGPGMTPDEICRRISGREGETGT